ncbi:hypothetical protein [Salicibibacter kimchii]|nr:hypothetical protein [Salicibibacter kimchii]
MIQKLEYDPDTQKRLTKSFGNLNGIRNGYKKDLKKEEKKG